MGKLKSLWSIKDLRDKLLFTALILLLFRIGCGLAVPFIDSSVMDAMFASGNTMDYLNMISGGALAQCAVFALGVTPYINASIIVQLLTVVFPSWEQAKKDPEESKKLERYTKIIGAVLAVVMAVVYYFILRNWGALEYTSGISGVVAALVIIGCFAAGAQLVVWLGNQIDSKGIGNGVSLIIFAGIVSRWSSLYVTVMSLWQQISNGEWIYLLVAVGLIVFFLASVWYVVYVSGSERRIPIVYSKRVVGRKMYGGQQTFIPLKLIMSGVLPVIFASTILSLPQTIGMFINAQKYPTISNLLVSFNVNSWIYCIIYVVLIFAFNYFYISIQYDPVEMANNLRKNGGVIPGQRPGKPTSDYIQNAMKQLASTGSFVLAVIALAPILLGNLTGYSIQMSGTSLLIVVSVAAEVVKAIDNSVVTRHHKGFLS